MRSAFAKKYQKWKVEGCKSVLWSDETKICLHIISQKKLKKSMEIKKKKKNFFLKKNVSNGDAYFSIKESLIFYYKDKKKLF